MSAQQIAEWVSQQPTHTIEEFMEGMEYYRWGEDIPNFGEFSTAFELGWQFAKIQAAG